MAVCFVREAAVTASGRGITEVVVGPVHAGIIEPGRFRIGTNGETIASFEMQFGFAHRGVETALIGRDAVGAAPAIARICGGCTAARSWAYARALEDLAGVCVDERSELARLLFAELERIYNHIFDLGAACAGAGYGYGRTAALGLVERVHRVCARLSGHRFLFDAIVPGGVRGEAFEGGAAVIAELETIRGDLERLVHDVLANDSVRRRFEGAGILSARSVRELGGVGPARRACGDPLDARIENPYGAYARIMPFIATQSGGDVAARFRVKTQELRESLRLASCALEHLGGAKLPAPQKPEVGAGSTTGIAEGARGVETMRVRTGARGALQSVSIISASARNWPLVARAMEGNIVPDFPLVNKSFNLCYACMDK
ncbi:MAG TPA: nickel-dependent hydrogenase large subunit [Candidatus Baltobacteraceae bacterium]|nr:nickel-dependent hydrogenase large subunit [Candidatus Baltobacteraceae bacterium]